MNQRIAPLIHSIRTFPSMMYEASLAPLQIIRQERDAKILLKKFPDLVHTNLLDDDCLKNVKQDHHQYISEISAPLISISYKQAQFLLRLVASLSPESILDLGSGFSTYIFALYNKCISANKVNIVSVDESSFWLKATTDFLAQKHLNVDRVTTYEEYLENNIKGKYEFYFVDIGGFELHLEIIESLLQNSNHDYFIVVDDFHVPNYRSSLKSIVNNNKRTILSLRKFTRTRLSHMAIIY